MHIIGHRGARGLAHENTRDALRAGIGAGADMIEFDVRVTHDGIPVLSHNSFLARDGKISVIANTDYAELKQFLPDLATLEEALDICCGTAVPLIEVKRGEQVAPIQGILRKKLAASYSPDQVMLGSKSQKTLRQLHAYLPEIPKVVIEPWSGIYATIRARQLGTKYVSMRSWWLWRGFLIAMKKNGYHMMVYTVNDPARLRHWQPYLNAVITDYPDRFKSSDKIQADARLL